MRRETREQNVNGIMHMCSKPIDYWNDWITWVLCFCFNCFAWWWCCSATLKAFWRRSFYYFNKRRAKKTHRRIRSKCKDNRTNSTRCLWQTCDSVDAQRPISRTHCSIFDMRCSVHALFQCLSAYFSSLSCSICGSFDLRSFFWFVGCFYYLS